MRQIEDVDEREAFISGWSGDAKALEYAIAHACERAAWGFNFRGIVDGPDGEPTLWLTQVWGEKGLQPPWKSLVGHGEQESDPDAGTNPRGYDSGHPEPQ
ncbi:MAG TPA: hypothetical protein VK191_17955 [Symbiobacteriaceae bacterium]|nr:hypothetical protein [Symbiobacteriaceae bacterium]